MVFGYLSAFFLGILFGVLSPIVSFVLNWLLAKFVITPLIGVQICFALNTVFSTNVFTVSFFPLCYATAAFIGTLIFKPNHSPSVKRK